MSHGSCSKRKAKIWSKKSHIQPSILSKTQFSTQVFQKVLRKSTVLVISGLFLLLLDYYKLVIAPTFIIEIFIDFL